MRSASTIAWLGSSALTQPRCPCPQMGPAESTRRWSSRPARPWWPVTTRSSTTNPKPTPVPTVISASEVQPTPAPNQCSVAVSARTSFSAPVGMPSRSVSRSARCTSVQPRNGESVTTWRPSTTARSPARAIPPATIEPNRPANPAWTAAIWSITASGSRAGMGSSWLATMRAPRSVTTANSASPVSLTPRKCRAACRTRSSSLGRPVAPRSSTSPSVTRPWSISARVTRVRLARDTPSRRAISARGSGPWMSSSRSALRSASPSAGQPRDIASSSLEGSDPIRPDFVSIIDKE